MVWKVVAPLGGTVTNATDMITPVYIGGAETFYDTDILLATGSGTFLTNTAVISNAAGPEFQPTGFGVASYSGSTGNRLLNTGDISGVRAAVRNVSTVDNAGTLSGTVIGAVYGANLVRNGYGDTTLARINGNVTATASITNLGTILGSAVVPISGSGITNGSPTSHAALIRGAATAQAAVSTGGVVLNYGTIEGTNTAFGGAYPAVTGNYGTNVTNSTTGIIRGASGVFLFSGAATPFTLANDGTIFGTISSGVRPGGFGVFPASNGGIVNGPTSTAALIAGAKYGILVQTSDMTIDNRATIAGTGTSGAGIADNTRSFVTNAATGTITGTRYGLLHPINAAGTLANDGLVSATGSLGIGVSVFLNGGSAIETITNAGTIIATGGAAAYGARIAGSLGNSGLIEGMANGVHSQGATITNSGTIRGDASDSYGLVINSFATVHNLAGGTIEGGAAGIRLNPDGAPVSIDNAGLITGAVGVSAGGKLTLVNGGTIAGTGGTAIAAGGDLFLSLLPGYGFVGNVVANPAGVLQGQLHLASAASTGTITGLGTAFQNFKVLGVDVGATWAVVGDNTLPSATSHVYGTLQLAGNLTGQSISPYGIIIEAGGTISGHGTLGSFIYPAGLLEAAGGTLVLAGRVAAHTAIRIAPGATAEATAIFAGFYQHDAFAFGGPNATLIVDTPTNFSNKLTHLAQSDRVDLVGIDVTSAEFIGSNLVVHHTGGADLSFPVASVDLINPVILPATDGAGGSILTFAGDTAWTVDAPGVTIDEQSGWGRDTISASIDYVLPANVEDLTLAGGALHGDGNALANLITGNALDNILAGLGGNDTLIGGAGNDRLDGGTGADAMSGGTGNDTYVVDNLTDGISEAAGEGTDTVQSSVDWTLGANIEVLVLVGTAINGTGNELANTITGNDGGDTLNGGKGNDNLTGGAGNDTLTGGAGKDTMVGGVGDDSYNIDNIGDAVSELANQGIDKVISSISYTLGSNVENLTLISAASVNGTGNARANIIIGNPGNNVLDGGDGNDTLRGAAGNDTLLGGAGNDRLDGGTGADAMSGGTGDDSFSVDTAGDVVIEQAGQGTDTVNASISYTLGDNVENLMLIGGRNLTGTGNALSNLITGNTGMSLLLGLGGDDTLIGGVNNDTLVGGAGSDTLTGGLGADLFRFGSVGDGGDLITDFIAGIDGLQVSAAGFGGGLVKGMDLGLTDRFVVGASATQAYGQFIYDGSSGALFWDIDGTGGIAAQQVATLVGLPALASNDVHVIV
ncbi:MAG: hypothetical protein NT133_20915 [Alphaproteobacteria bacterium]|nr:hypothetical protein [Alphaproteobacteria bacterium]